MKHFPKNTEVTAEIVLAMTNQDAITIKKWWKLFIEQTKTDYNCKFKFRNDIDLEITSWEELRRWKNKGYAIIVEHIQ